MDAITGLGRYLGAGHRVVLLDGERRLLACWPEDAGAQPGFWGRGFNWFPADLKQWVLEGDREIVLYRRCSDSRQLWVLAEGGSKSLGRLRLGLSRHLEAIENEEYTRAAVDPETTEPEPQIERPAAAEAAEAEAETEAETENIEPTETPADQTPTGPLRVEDGKEELLLGLAPWKRLSVSPSLKWVAGITDEGVLEVCSLPDGRQLGKLESASETAGLVHAPDGKTLGIIEPQAVTLFDLETGRSVRRTDSSTLAFSSDSTLMALTGPTHYCRIVERETNTVISEFHPYPDEVMEWRNFGYHTNPPLPGPFFSALAIHGNLVAGGVYPKPYLDLWELPSVPRIARMELENFPRSVALNDRFAVCHTPEHIWVRRMSGGAVSKFPIRARSLALHPSEPLIVAVTRDYQNVEIDLNFGEIRYLEPTFFSVCFAADGSWITDHHEGFRIAPQRPSVFPFSGDFQDWATERLKREESWG